MSVAGSRVAIVGGSIAGCAVAKALRRAGCDAHVYERSSGGLQDRGSGIAIPQALWRQLVAEGYLPDDAPQFVGRQRFWVIADGTPAGRVLWAQRSPEISANNWGVLWRGLRAAVPDNRFHDDLIVEDFTTDDDGGRRALLGRHERPGRCADRCRRLSIIDTGARLAG